MTDVDTTTPPAPEDHGIKALRAAHEEVSKRAREAEQANAELKAQLQAIERAKMDENERLKLELADRAKQLAEYDVLRAENGRFVSEFENLYKAEIEGVRAEFRPIVESLSAQGSWPDRVRQLREAIALTQVASPGLAGTKTAPPAATPPTVTSEAPRLDPKNPESWGSWSTVLPPKA